MRTKLEPKLISLFKEGYSKKDFFHDLIAGVIVGIVALPLSIAFGIASGVKPEQGLFTAVIAGFLISAFSGSRFQIGGPTGAFIVIVYNIVQQYGYDGLATATLMAGVLLVIMGFARFGAIIKFIPYPVTVGFTSGIALIIFTSQLRDVFGLPNALPADFVHKFSALFEQRDFINFPAIFIAACSSLILWFWPKMTKKIPGSLVAIVAMTAVVHFFGISVETIGSRFGSVASHLPRPHFPAMSLSLIQQLLPVSITIAMLAGIESLLSAVVADGMTGRRHRSNMELVAQGIANIISPLFLGIPATGAIARTATSIKNGARSPVAGIIHALTILLILLFFGKYAALIPMPVLAALLMFVAYHMSEWQMFVKILKSPFYDISVLLVTFFLTVLVDLTAAIQVGVVLAALLFMYRMADTAQAGYVTDSLNQEDENQESLSLRQRKISKGIKIFEIQGPFFFGAADKFKDALQMTDIAPKVLILRMRMVPTIDATGMRAIEDVHARCKREGTQVILTGVSLEVQARLEKSGFIAKLGVAHVIFDMDQALQKAESLLLLS